MLLCITLVPLHETCCRQVCLSSRQHCCCHAGCATAAAQRHTSRMLRRLLRSAFVDLLSTLASSTKYAFGVSSPRMSNSVAMAGADRDPRDSVRAAAPAAARLARSAAVVCGLGQAQTGEQAAGLATQQLCRVQIDGSGPDARGCAGGGQQLRLENQTPCGPPPTTTQIAHLLRPANQLAPARQGCDTLGCGRGAGRDPAAAECASCGHSAAFRTECVLQDRQAPERCRGKATGQHRVSGRAGNATDPAILLGHTGSVASVTHLNEKSVYGEEEGQGQRKFFTHLA